MKRTGNGLRLPLGIGALLFLIALFSLVAGGCGGGGGGGGGTATTITGQVLNSANGDQPVEGAKVTIGGATAVTRTRDNADAQHNVGTFIINNPSVGATTASIDLTGTTDAPNGGPAVQTVAFTPPVGNGTNVTQPLYVNIGQVRGRVLLPNGQPAANGFVTVGATGESQQVGTNGVFLITLVPAGNTQVFAVQGTASATKNVTVGFGLNDAGDIHLVDDPNPNPPGAPFTVTGTVTVTDLGAVSGTQIVLFRNGVQVETAATNGSGQYFFFVPPGTYSIRAFRNGYQDANSAPFTLTDPNTPVVTDLTLSPI